MKRKWDTRDKWQNSKTKSGKYRPYELGGRGCPVAGCVICSDPDRVKFANRKRDLTHPLNGD